jgi:hypothetical protein
VISIAGMTAGRSVFSKRLGFFMIGVLSYNKQPQAKLFRRAAEVKFFCFSIPGKQKNMNFLHEI